MKRTYILLLIILSLCSFCACGAEEPAPAVTPAPTAAPTPAPTPTPDPWESFATEEEAEAAAGFEIRLPIMEEASVAYRVKTDAEPAILEAVFSENDVPVFTVQKTPGTEAAAGEYPYTEEAELLPGYFPVTLSGESDADIRTAVWTWESCAYRIFFEEGRANSEGALQLVKAVADGLPDADAYRVAGSIIACGDNHTVAVRKDGTVVATGANRVGQCDVEEWTDIVAVAAGPEYTVGLRKDGTVVATGLNNNQQCKVDEWTDIIDICTNQSMTFGLRADGTVVHTLLAHFARFDIEDLAEITDAVEFAPNSVLRRDGSITSLKPVFRDPEPPYVFSRAAQEERFGSPVRHLCSVKMPPRGGYGLQLRDMLYILENGEIWGDRDGSGEMGCLEEFSDSFYLTGGFGFVMGLNRDGSVVSAGYNPSYFSMDFADVYDRHGELSCREWTDMIALAGNDCVNSNGIAFCAGVRSDGTVAALGYNGFGQCDVAEWTDIGYPYQLADRIVEPVAFSFAELCE